MNIKNIVVLSFFPAFFPPRSGGEERLYGIYSRLSEKANITLISSSYFGAPTTRIAHNSRFTEYRVSKDENYVLMDGIVERLGGLGDRSGLAVSLSGLFPNEFHKIYFDHYEYADVIIHESPFTLNYDVMAGLDDKLRIYNSYNAEYILMQSLHESEDSSYIIDYVKASESLLLETAGLVTYCSEQDRINFENLIGKPLPNSIMLPNGTSKKFNLGALKKRRLGNVRPTAIFIGSDHAPNKEAVAVIVRDIAPYLQDVDFQIVGSCAPVGLLSSNVTGYGLVTAELKEKLLQKADVALNPMSTGSGSNLKVMDYMAYGIPIVSTSFGMRGTFAKPDMHYKEAQIARTAEAIRQVLADPAKTRSMAESAFRLVQERLTWDAIALQFYEEIDATISKISSLKAKKAQSDTRRPSEKSDNERSEGCILCLNDYDILGGSGGGVTRMLNLQTALAKHRKVISICLWDGDTIGIDQSRPNLLIIRIPKTDTHRQDTAKYNSKFHVSVADIISYRHAAANPMLNFLYRAFRNNAETVVLEHPYMAALVKKYGDAFVYSSHNDELQLKSELLRHHPDRQELICEVEAAEDYCLKAAQLICAVSPDDIETFSRRFDRSGPPAIVVRNGAEPAAEPTPDDLALVADMSEESVVFIGSSHFPNAEAVWRIRDLYARDLPHVEFHIIGSSGLTIGEEKPNNVRIWGEVSKSLKAAIMGRAKLAINPVDSGGGSNIKISDYFAHGLPVVSTPFGIRGYPKEILSYVRVVDVNEFSAAINSALEMKSRDDRNNIEYIFRNLLSFDSIGQTFAERIISLSRKKPKILFSTYRYVSPPVGGGEYMMLELIRQIASRDKFDIDVVSFEASHIRDEQRFSSIYESSRGLPVPLGMPNVAWKRFGPDKRDPELSNFTLSKFWRAQPEFERVAASSAVSNTIARTGLLHGWHSIEVDGQHVARWTTNRFSVTLGSSAKVSCAGFSPRRKEVLIRTNSGASSETVDGVFNFEFSAEAGTVELEVEGDQSISGDLRVLGLRITSFLVNERELIGSPTAWELLKEQPFMSTVEALAKASEASRKPAGLKLSDQRGPFSSQMLEWMTNNVRNYDLVITHNCALKTAIDTLNIAKEAEVPSIFVPHIHLDDDYYHFPDISDSFRKATLSLVSPRAAVSYLSKNEADDVRYFGAGVSKAEFDADPEGDIAAFREVYPDTNDFILVLGRKSPVKNYKKVLEAGSILRAQGRKISVVLIGPDDDNHPVGDDGSYLGMQPRNVVRGALRSALALVNMSGSESFGIVLLEAWLAHTPVIANRECPAFHDLVEHGENGYLVSNPIEIADHVVELIGNVDRRRALVHSGIQKSEEYEWVNLALELEKLCIEVIASRMKATNLQNGGTNV